MRLKTFHATTMTDAMNLVREELGPDAIIVSTTDNGDDGVRITAAVEKPEPEFDFAGLAANQQPLERICDALDRHGAPRELADRLLNTASMIDAADVTQIFASTLDLTFEFSGNREVSKGPVLLYGPPGAGKTSAVAKMAARAVVDETPVTLVSTDTIRAGAVQQLEAYGGRLKLPVKTATDAASLRKALDRVPSEHLVLIDTTSVNPFVTDDLSRLEAISDVARMNRILVMSAGRDALEAQEIAAAFDNLSPRRLLFTGLDMTRRLGALLTVADSIQSALGDISDTPEIAGGLRRVNPVMLARLLLVGAQPRTAGAGHLPSPSPRQATGWK